MTHAIPHARSRNRSFWSSARLMLAVLAALVLTGCVSVDGPEQSDLADVRAGKSTVVLFRLLVTSNAGPLAPFDETLESQCMSVALSPPGSPGHVLPVDGLESFSEATLEAGWLYFVVPAGKYAFAVNPPSLYDARGDDRWHDTAHWGFEIPPDTDVVYVGTIRAHCRAEGSDFGGARVREIRAQKILNQSAEAAKLAAEHLPDLDPPVTLPTRRLYSRESTILRGAN